jgi:hypothetical protein
MLSLFKRNSTGARLWISDHRADDQRREATKIYDALEKLFEIERNLLAIPLLLSMLATVVALLAYPPSLSRTGWQGSVAVTGSVLVGTFLLSWIVVRFCSRGAHKRILGELRIKAAQKRVQLIIKHLSDQDRALRPLVRRYHLAKESS